MEGLKVFLLNDSKTEFENMINFLCFLFEMMLTVGSLAQASGVKMGLSIGRAS